MEKAEKKQNLKRQDSNSQRRNELKKTWTLPLAILAMTLITLALFAPFALAHNSKSALVTIDLCSTDIDSAGRMVERYRDYDGKVLRFLADGSLHRNGRRFRAHLPEL